MNRIGAWAFAAIMCCWGSILGCNRSQPPQISDLKFPVLVIYPNAGTEVFGKPEDLNTMSLQRVMMYKDTAGLVDSELRIFQLANLRSTKNGLAIWIDGGRGPTPVAFDLVATQESGLAAARDWICRSTSRFTEGPSADEERANLEAAGTLDELIALVSKSP